MSGVVLCRNITKPCNHLQLRSVSECVLAIGQMVERRKRQAEDRGKMTQGRRCLCLVENVTEQLLRGIGFSYLIKTELFFLF